MAPLLNRNATLHTRRRVFAAGLALLTATFTGLALGQPLPDFNVQRGAEAERQARERDQQRQQQLQPGTDVRLTPEMPSAALQRLPENEQPCFAIQRIRLQGTEGTPIRLERMRAALAGHNGADPPEGRCLGAQGINLLIARAQNDLIAQGFVTSRVLAPAQDLTTGELVLQVIPGRINRIRLADPQPRATLFNAFPGRAGDVLQLRDIEQGLENLKRVPTAEADIQIAPGEEPASSDVVVQWNQPSPWRVNLFADDSGSRSTGKYQGAATFSYDHALTLNDLLYVTASGDLGGGDAGNRGTRGLAAHYSVPFGYWLLAFNSTQNNYFQTVAGATQDYLYSGSSAMQDVRLSHLFYRDASNKSTWSVRGFARQSRNYIDDTEIEVQRRRVGGYELGVQQRSFVGRSILDGSLAYRRGTGAFRANEAPEEAFGEGTHQFKLWTAQLQIQTPFNVGTQPFEYLGTWRWQTSQTPLTPQDRFSIGGRYTVRGFDGERSLTGDRGWLFRNELSTPVAGSAQRVYAAIDHGQVDGPSTAALVGRQLTGVAAGLRGQLAGVQYDVFVGAPLDKPQGFRTASVTAGFALSFQF